jgi:hypothetical protein
MKLSNIELWLKEHVALLHFHCNRCHQVSPKVGQHFHDGMKRVTNHGFTAIRANNIV